MSDYFDLISKELLGKLGQVKDFIKRHNPTIGVVTEEILRSFLKVHLPKFVSVEQGFVSNLNGDISKQCDIIIYDSMFYAPFYRINDIVIVPADAVITIIEVKTSIDARRFHEVLDYFKEVKNICFKPAYLFIYNAPKLGQLYGYFESYAAENGPYTYDHDTAQLLPDEITGIQTSYHITQDLVVGNGSDTLGYSAWSFKDETDKEIGALQNFYLSIYERVENYISDTMKLKLPTPRKNYYTRRFQDYRAFSLFEL